jgi:hypothetical protein
MGPPYLPVAMIEIPIRDNEYTTAVQETCYFAKFLRLNISHVFKHALRNDYVEFLVAESDWIFNKVRFNQIRRRVMYGNINAIVLYIWR